MTLGELVFGEHKTKLEALAKITQDLSDKLNLAVAEIDKLKAEIAAPPEVAPPSA